MSRTGQARVGELDFFRGIALILMIIYHFLYNLKEFFAFPIAYNSGIFYYVGKMSGTLFIVIAAISCRFSRNNFWRACKFLGTATLITVVTYLYNPEFTIRFGILHFLGISILLYPLFRCLHWLVLVLLGTGVIILGQYLGPVSPPNNYLFMFNLTNSSWISADYYPLFPWFGVFLYGIALGHLIYSRKETRVRWLPRNPVSFVGRHTLLIYLVHQPVLLLLTAAWVGLNK